MRFCWISNLVFQSGDFSTVYTRVMGSRIECFAFCMVDPSCHLATYDSANRNCVNHLPNKIFVDNSSAAILAYIDEDLATKVRCKFFTLQSNYMMLIPPFHRKLAPHVLNVALQIAAIKKMDKDGLKRIT